MGTPRIAADILERLASRHEMCGVLCQPDKPAGRKGELSVPEAKQRALELGVPVFQPRTLRSPEIPDMIRDLGPDLIAVVAYGKILPPDILAIPRYGCVNMHASLLPRYRGAAPLQRALMNGETRTGLTAMLMDEGLDTGGILLQDTMDISDADDIDSLFERAAERGGELMLEAVRRLEEGTAVPVRQDPSLATYAPPLTRADGRVDFTSMDAREIFCRVRALARWPVAYFEREGGAVKIRKAFLSDLAGQPGTVLDTGPLTVAAREGAVILDSLTPEGRKTQSGRDFCLGQRIRPGQFIHRK